MEGVQIFPFFSHADLKLHPNLLGTETGTLQNGNIDTEQNGKLLDVGLFFGLCVLHF